MIQFRRLVSVLLGLWIGAGIVVDVAVTQNFSTVDRFLQDPGNVATSIELKEIGRDRARELMRRNAGEENNFLFENWERAELAIGVILLLILLFGERPQITMLALTAAMFTVVLVQHFILSPKIVEMGRTVAGLPGESAEAKRFWMFHGIYSGIELLKLALGFAFAVRLIVRRRQDPDYFKTEYEKNEAQVDGSRLASGKSR